MSLELDHLDHDGQRKRVFRNWKSAVEHLLDHLLTHPESAAWQVLLDLPRESVEQRRQRGQEAIDTEGESLQPQYDQLLELLRETLRTAEEQGSDWPQRKHVHAYFGLNGVLAALDDFVLRTAFVPGLGAAHRVKPVPLEDRGEDPLPREPKGDPRFRRTSAASYEPGETGRYQVYCQAARWLASQHMNTRALFRNFRHAERVVLLERQAWRDAGGR